jgi:hypothetical protein
MRATTPWVRRLRLTSFLLVGASLFSGCGERTTSGGTGATGGPVGQLQTELTSVPAGVGCIELTVVPEDDPAKQGCNPALGQPACDLPGAPFGVPEPAAPVPGQPVNRHLPVTEGAPASLTVGGLPPGGAQVSARAFAGPCTAVTPDSVASWFTGGIALNLEAGQLTSLPLTLHPATSADLTVTFPDPVPGSSSIPAGVQCLELTMAAYATQPQLWAAANVPTDTIHRQLAVTPGAPARFSIPGLPPGQVEVTAQAFSTLCAAVTAESAASYSTTLVTDVLLPGQINPLGLSMLRAATAGAQVSSESLTISTFPYDGFVQVVADVANPIVLQVKNNSVAAATGALQATFDPPLPVVSSTSSCGSSLAPLQACAISVTVIPSISGRFRVTVADAAGRSGTRPLTIAVTALISSTFHNWTGGAVSYRSCLYDGETCFPELAGSCAPDADCAIRGPSGGDLILQQPGGAEFYWYKPGSQWNWTGDATLTLPIENPPYEVWLVDESY